MSITRPNLARAYLAGLVGADGHLETDSPYVVIASKEHKFLQDFVAPLVCEQTRRIPQPYWDRSAKVWKIHIYSRQLWTSLNTVYAIPAGRKSSKIIPPENMIPAECIQYLRGWFDGEGWTETMTVRRSYGTYRYPRIGFKVKSRLIRDWMLSELASYGVAGKGYKRRDGSYGLWINGTKACQAFLDAVGFLYPPRNDQLRRLVHTNRGRINPNQAGIR